MDIIGHPGRNAKIVSQVSQISGTTRYTYVLCDPISYKQYIGK